MKRKNFVLLFFAAAFMILCFTQCHKERSCGATITCLYNPDPSVVKLVEGVTIALDTLGKYNRINELRLSGFDDKQGFAALLRARVNLADVGDLTVSGSYMSPGFGSIEQSVTERSMDTKYNLDIAANLDGGKILFPEKWNIKIPVHYDYSLGIEQPEYNPLNPDVRFGEGDCRRHPTD